MSARSINLDPSPKDLRIFGFLFLAFFVIIAGLTWWKPQGVFFGAAIAFVLWAVSMWLNTEASRKQQLAGVSVAIVFGIIGGIPTYFPELQMATVYTVLGIAVAGFLVIEASPWLARKIYLGWMYAVLPEGWTFTNIILAAVYFLVMTPIGLIMRVFGRDPMTRTLDRSASTYWVPHNPANDPKRYFRQF